VNASIVLPLFPTSIPSRKESRVAASGLTVANLVESYLRPHLHSPTQAVLESSAHEPYFTTNFTLPFNVPNGVTTETVPVVALCGTVARMQVSDTTVNAADIPLNVTELAPFR